jgi:hypothetical protein
MVAEKEEGSTRTAYTAAGSILDWSVDPIFELPGLIPCSV